MNINKIFYNDYTQIQVIFIKIILNEINLLSQISKRIRRVVCSYKYINLYNNETCKNQFYITWSLKRQSNKNIKTCLWKFVHPKEKKKQKYWLT